MFCVSQSFGYFSGIWPVRLMVRTSPFHGANGGSIPSRATNFKLNTMRTESIILSSGIQVNRTRKNGVTIITTGAIQKVNYLKHFWTTIMVGLFSLAFSGSIAVTANVVSEVAKDGAMQLLFFSPIVLFIGFLLSTSLILMIQAMKERYEKK